MDQRLTFALKRSVDEFTARANRGVLSSWPQLVGAIPIRTRRRLQARIAAALSAYRAALTDPEEQEAFDDMLIGTPYALTD